MALQASVASAGAPVLPTGGTFVAGAGAISGSGAGALSISQSSLRGIIDWNSFSIGAGGAVRINNGSGATLNRVTGGLLSRIDGLLTATGSVYLVNPNGVVVGDGGKILSGGAIGLSTRDISASGFMTGGALAASGTSAGGVSNLGQIFSATGDVVLIGRAVTNSGSISAPKGSAVLAAGDDILMSDAANSSGVYVAAGGSGDVTDTGRIAAASVALKAAGGDVYTLAGNRSGLIQATGATTVNGQVWLSAPGGSAVVGGTISAVNADGSGGAVTVDAARVEVASGATISATGTKGGAVLIGVSGPGGVGLADQTSVASGAVIRAGGPAGGGYVETSGRVLSLGSATIAPGSDGSWLVDPVNLTIDATAASTLVSSLNSGANVTEQTTASGASGYGVQSAGVGDITVSAPITWTGSGGLTLNAYNNLNVNAAISGGGALSFISGAATSLNAAVSSTAAVSLSAGSGLTIGAAVSGASVLGSAGAGNLTLASGGSVAGATGVTLGTTASFVNAAGASALSAGTGRWLVYSANPANDTPGGLTPDFIQYAASFGAAGSGATAPTPSSGNGLLYSLAPSVGFTLPQAVSKTYDGLTTVAVKGAQLSATGLINGDNVTATGTYAGADVGQSISLTIANPVFLHGSTPVFGYAVTTPSLTGAIGQITAASLTASIVGDPTKVYDGTTTPTLSASNYLLSGFASGQGASINQPSSVAYASAEAGPETITAGLSATNFVANSGTKLSNYVLPTTASGAGAITPAPLVIAGVLATNKTYDRTTSDTLSTAAASLYGVINGDAVSLSTANAQGAFATINAGSGLAVTASGFALTGAKAGDYQLIQPTGLAASINPATLTVSNVLAQSKVYDGTLAATLTTSSAVLVGVVSGDSLTLGVSGATGAFASKNVGSSVGVTASGFTIAGAGVQNYALQQPAGLSANITPATLSVSLTGTPEKTYDGTDTAVVSASSYQLSGFVPGEGGSVAQTSHVVYAGPNAGAETVIATLTISDFAVNAGTSLSNYVVPTSATAVGLIDPAPLTIGVVGDPTKVYDGSTGASLTASNYALSGFLSGQGATVNQSIGTYASANAGVSMVSASLSAANLTANSGTMLSNYSIPATATGWGTITARPVNGSIYAAIVGDPTKTYDGTTTATLTSADFSLSGFVNGQGATVIQTAGTYASKNVGSQPITASLTPSNFQPDSGTNLSNYTLPTTAYGTGEIDPAQLTAAIVGAPSKVYNGTTTAVLTGSNYQFSGFALGEGVSVASATAATYASADAGSPNVTTSFAITDLTPTSGTLLSNYILPTSATGTGLITQAPLTILGVKALGKTYDTTTAASLNIGSASLFGMVGSDAVTLSSGSASATFTTASAGSGVAVTATGFSISGAKASDYQLAQPSGLSATIAPKAVTVAGVSAQDKAYDATTAATLNLSNATLQGVYSSDTGSVALSTTGVSASFGSVNVGSQLAVSDSGFALTGAAMGDYTVVQPGGLTASITPRALTADITGDPTKVYDGTTSVTLHASDYTLVGFVAGQGASVPQSATAQYGSPNAGQESVSSTLVSSDFVANAGTNLSNYQLPTTGAGLGTITQAPLSVALVGKPTKTYDSTTAATLTSANFALGGFVTGQSASIIQTAGTYAAAAAGAQAVSAVLAGSNYTAGSGTMLSNYSLPTTATGAGLITPAALSVIGVSANSRAYNGGTAATLATGGAGVSGLFGSDSVNLGVAGASGLFASKNVGTAIPVTASGFTISGGQSADYVLSQPTGLSANITAAQISLASVTKVYDSGTALPTGSSAYALNGLFGGDQVSVDTSSLTGAYADKNVGSGKGVSYSGLALSGTQAGDYQIASSASGAPIGVITQATLTVSGVAAQSKVYDATTTAQLDNSSAYLGGLYSGDAVSFSAEPATGVFASKNVGPAVAVTASGYTIQGGDAANYRLTQPTGLSAAITQNTSLTLTSITKVYDGGVNLPTTGAAYVLSGVLGSDHVTVNASGVSGSYQSANVGNPIGLNSISGLSFSGADAADYAIGSGFTTNTIGIITARPLSVAIVGTPTKTYDATVAATLNPASYNLTGFVSGQGASITQANGTYASAQARPETVSASLAASNYTASGATLLSNYILPTAASGAGLINKAPLTITGVSANSKVYDGGVVDTLNTFSAGLSGVVSGDTVNLVSSGYAAAFASKDVGNGIAVSANGFALSGAQAIDYTLAQPTGLSANITAAMLSLTNVGKIYDSTTGLPTSSAAYTLGGVVSGDAVSVNTAGLSGTYAAKNVGTGLSVSLAGLSLTGAQAGDYTIGSSLINAAIGTITQAPLTLTGVTAESKVYDGTRNAALDSSAAAFSGLYAGDLVTFSASSAAGTFATANVGSAIAVTSAGYTIGGTDAGNYSFTQPTGLSAAITPALLSVAIINTPTKTYNGSTAAALIASNYNLTGFVTGQSATIGQTSGTYASANAGAEGVTASLSTSNFTAGSGTLLSNYTLPTTASGAGQINQAALSAAIVNTPTKTYDGGTAATLASTNYSLTGFVTGQSATVGQTSGTYASANAGSENVSASLAASNFTAGSGTLLSNYLLPTTASGMGHINKATLSAAIVNTPTKTYNGGTAATLASTNYSLTGFITGQSATVTQTSGTYASANAGAEAVSAALAGSNFIAGSGTLLANYTLPTTASGAGQINPAVLSAAIVNTPTKTYDGGTAATLASTNYSLTGFVTGQSATVGQTSGTYAGADAGAEGVSTSLSAPNFTAGSGTLLSNYVLPTTASGAGQINQAALNASIVNTPTKIYDGGTGATLVSTNYSLTGFVTGQSATVGQTSGTYASADAGAEGASANLSSSDFTAGSGTLLSNYVLPTSANGAGLINAAQLTASIVNTPTKTYDGGTGATLTSTNYSLTGFVTGQSATIGQASGTYASANAGAETVSAALSGSNFTASSGTLLSNYTLPTTASGAGQINAAALSASIVNTPTKIYDGGTAATLTSTNYSLTGFVTGQSATVGQTSGTYASPNAGAEGVSATLSSTDFTASAGTQLSNYVLPTAASGAGQINAAQLTAAITGTPTKTYDGRTAATLASSDYTLSGFIAGQGASITQTSGTYASANAGAEAVSTVLSGFNFTAGSGTLLSNYVLPTTAGGTGLINPAVLSAAIVNTPTKTYDGGTAATLASTNYSLTGFVTGQSATVGQTSGTYAGADAGAEGVSTSLSAPNFTAGSGTLLSNYVLPTTASGAGQINQAALNASIVNTPTKIYDGGTGATLVSTNYSLTGFVTGQSATVGQTSGTYASADAGAEGASANLSSSDFTAGSGTLLSNYVLPTSANGAGLINAAQLTASIVNTPTKIYDGGTGATLAASNYSLTGFVTGQSATIGQASGNYASANAGAETVSAALAGSNYTPGSGTLLSNYVLPTTASGAGQINAAALSAAIINTPTKTYEGGTAATLASTNYSLTGFVTGQSATVGQTSGTYASPNAGAEAVSAALSGSDFTAGSGTLLSNYILPTAASGAGQINAAQLTAAITGTPTKTYDATAAATLASSDYTLGGFAAGQGATVIQTSGTYASADAGPEAVSATLSGSDFTAGSGTLLSNYVLPTSASGAGLINAAQLTAVIVNTPTKIYDGGTIASLTSTNYSITGFVTGQSAVVGQSSGTYAAANAGAETVTASLSAPNFTAGSGTQLSNYILPTSASGAGQINAAQLSVAIVNTPTKTYDGGAGATLTSSNYNLTGFVASQGATVGQTSGTYASADAGAEGVSANLSSSDFNAGSGTLLSNYVLPTIASGAGLINAAQLTASIVNTPSKTYDGGTSATLNSTNYSLTGFVTGQSATIAQASGTYASANAGAQAVGAALSPADFTAGSGTQLSNYVLPTIAGGAGLINPAALGVAIVNTPTKTYDGGTAATLASTNYSLTGFVNGQSATVRQTSGTYASADAGAEGVSASLAASDFTAASGTLVSNYVLPTAASGAGQINAAQLTAAITGTPTKTYDGTTAALLASGAYTLSGFAAGQGASVTQTGGLYAGPNAGAEAVSTTLAASDFSAQPGTVLANYVLPTFASGVGQINPAQVSASITGAPTKTYDGGTAATLAASDYSLTGFIAGQGATVGQTNGTYASANAGAEGVAASLSAANYTAGPGTVLANYILPTTASGTGQINQAQLAAAITGTPTRSYDATTTAALTPSDYTLSGFVAGQGAAVTRTIGSYADADAGSEGVSTSLAASDFAAAAGTLLANYVLPTSAGGTGRITPAQLTASLTGTPTKTYDGGSSAMLSSTDYSLSGFAPGQGASVDQASGTYASPNAGAQTVSATLTGSQFTATSGTRLSNYVLPTTATGAGQIKAAPLTASITGTPTKTYDGGTTATVTSSDYSLTGFVAGQGALVTQAGGTYASASAGAQGVDAGLSASDFTAGSGTLLSNYVLPTNASGAGQINAAPLTASITGTPTKTYDGGTVATLASSDYSLTGFVAGQGATVTQGGGTYASANAGVQGVGAALSASDFAPGAGTLLSNYVLPTTATGAGQIKAAPLAASITGTPTKTYDGGTTATLATSDYSLTGFVAGQGATVTQGGGTYASANAGVQGVGSALSASDFAPGAGTQLSNYVLPTTASGAGQINAAPLTASITGTPTKTYDGGTAATLASSDYSLTGFVSGQGATITQAGGNYVSANAGTQGVGASLSASDFTPGSATLLSNYVLPTTASGAGRINPAQLSASITGPVSKTYDGTTAATLVPADYALSGFVAGQGASVAQASGAYASAATGVEGVSVGLSSSDFVAAPGTLLSNYVLPTSAVGTGLINPGETRQATALAALLNNGAETGQTPSIPVAEAAVFAIATPLTYIPYPAPDSLSTWVKNGFGALPSIVEANAATDGDDATDTESVRAGPPVINSTEQILLQGDKSKSWSIQLPSSSSGGTR